MHPTLTHNRIPAFLILSVALHACVLTLFKESMLSAPESRPGNSVLEIHLQAVELAPTLTPPVKTVIVSPAVVKVNANTSSSVEKVAHRVPAVSTAEIRPDPAITMNETKENLHKQLLGVLKTRISQYLTYPALARNRGWEGTVLLGMRVESDGRLDQLRIDRSSGYTVLDHSALNSLNRVGYITEASAWLKGRNMDMQLPVIYRLIDN